MANLTSDFCPYDSFDDYSTVFGAAISDPNPLVKEELPPPLSDAEMRTILAVKKSSTEPPSLHSGLRPQVNALERKYGVDTIPADDLRVWKAAMTDAWLDHASEHHRQWEEEVEQTRKELETSKSAGAKWRLETHLKRLQTADSRSTEWQTFLERHGVTEEELQDHPMYAPRGVEETVLHPLALMVKRYREVHPLISSVDGVDDANDDETSGESVSPLKTEDPQEPKEEEVPKAKSWFPSIW